MNPISRHERVAFQFSGGKDSTAALLLLRPYWGQMTVYWLNSGDIFPETKEFILRVTREIPRVVEVAGGVLPVIEIFGPPSDVIPAPASEEAHSARVAGQPRIQNRVLCCIRAKMTPMHIRMRDDKISLIVRGQKKADEVKGPLMSGDVMAGFEVYYPIQDWSDSDVVQFLSDLDMVPPLYGDGMNRSGDCMRCSAWLGDTRAQYLKQHHPLAYRDYAARLEVISRALTPSLENFQRELERMP